MTILKDGGVHYNVLKQKPPTFLYSNRILKSPRLCTPSWTCKRESQEYGVIL